MAGYQFFTAQTTNGDSALYQGIDIDQVRPCPLAVYFTGVFGSATVTAYATADGVNWLTIPGLSPITAPAIMLVNISASALKFTITGATGTTSISGVSASNI